MTPEAEDQLVGRWMAQLDRLRTGAASRAVGVWDDLGSWDREDVQRFFDALDDFWPSVRDAAASSTDGFIATLTESQTIGLTGKNVATVPPDPMAGFITLWKHLADGSDWSDAFEAGRSTVDAGARTFVTRSASTAGDEWFAGRGVTNQRWRRQLSGKSCEWCALVATQVYRSSASASFGHRNCDCVPVPITQNDTTFSGVITGELYDNVRRARTSQRIDERRASARLDRQASNAEQRMRQALDELDTEADPQRRMRLQERARKWEARAEHDRARAAEAGAAPKSHAPEGWTGYVDPSGHPVPRP